MIAALPAVTIAQMGAMSGMSAASAGGGFLAGLGGLANSAGSFLSNNSGSLLSGAGSLLGGLFGNSSASKENHRNRKLQLYMFNKTMEEYRKRYQTAVTDMKAAGLNPLLAVTGGGSMAGSPPSGGSAGSSVTPVNLFAGLGQIAHSAIEFKKVANEAKLIDAQTKKINQEVLASQSAITQDKARLDNEIKMLKLRQDELENKKLDSASERKKRDAEISSLKDQLSTAVYQRGLLQQQINETHARIPRSRYGDKISLGGVTFSLGGVTAALTDALSGSADIGSSMLNFASSAMQKFNVQKRLEDQIAREVQSWNNRGQNFQRLYHRVRSSPVFKSNRRNTMYRSSYFPHQSDFR